MMWVGVVVSWLFISLIKSVMPIWRPAPNFQGSPNDPVGVSSNTLPESLLFTPDNTYDIGANGANRPRNVYVANSIVAGSGIILRGFSYLSSGVGVPSTAYGSNGDFWFRQDTPGTAMQNIYTKVAGTWTGIV